MKKETKQILGIASKFTITYLAMAALGLAPGTQGEYNRTEFKIFRKGIKYRFTPFGDKEKLAKELDYLEKKSDRLYNKLEKEQYAKQKTKRR